jgi:hypothetical protein
MVGWGAGRVKLAPGKGSGRSGWDEEGFGPDRSGTLVTRGRSAGALAQGQRVCGGRGASSHIHNAPPAECALRPAIGGSSAHSSGGWDGRVPSATTPSRLGDVPGACVTNPARSPPLARTLGRSPRPRPSRRRPQPARAAAEMAASLSRPSLPPRAPCGVRKPSYSRVSHTADMTAQLWASQRSTSGFGSIGTPLTWISMWSWQPTVRALPVLPTSPTLSPAQTRSPSWTLGGFFMWAYM